MLPSCDQLLEALLELLALHRVDRARRARSAPAESAGCRSNSRIPGPVGERVADAEDAGIEHADDVPREGLVDRWPVLLRQELRRVRESGSSCRPHVAHFMPRTNLPEQMRTNAMRSRCSRIHVRLDLEDEAREARCVGRDRSLTRRNCCARRGQGPSRERREERLDAEVRQRAAEEHRASVSPREHASVEGGCPRRRAARARRWSSSRRLVAMASSRTGPDGEDSPGSLARRAVGRVLALLRRGERLRPPVVHAPEAIAPGPKTGQVIG
jgi:hypothetical protein